MRPEANYYLWSLPVFVGMYLVILFPASFQTSWSFSDQHRNFRIIQERLDSNDHALSNYFYMGRITPMTWLAMTVQQVLFGEWQSGIYLLRGIYLIIGLLALLLLLREANAPPLYCGFLAGLPLISAPLADTAYISVNGEVYLCLFLGLAVYCAYRVLAVMESENPSMGSQVFWLSSLIVCETFAVWSKETGLVCYGMHALLLPALFIQKRGLKSKDVILILSSLFLVVMISWVIPRLATASIPLSPVAGKEYMRVNPTFTSMAYNLKSYVLLLPEATVPLLFIPLILCSKCFECFRLTRLTRLGVIVWMGAVAYFLILVLWNQPWGYYLYPCSFLALIGTALLLVQVPKLLCRPVWALGAMLFITANAIALYQSTSLIHSSWKGWEETIDTFCELAPPDAQLLIFPCDTSRIETIYEASLHATYIRNRPDLSILPGALPDEDLSWAWMTPLTVNELLLLKKPFYVMDVVHSNTHINLVRYIDNTHPENRGIWRQGLSDAAVSIVNRFAVNMTSIQADLIVSLSSRTVKTSFLKPIEIEYTLYRVDP